MFGRTIAWVWRIIGGTTWGLEVLSVLFFLGPSFLPFLDSVGRITLCCILTWVLNVYKQRERHISLEFFVLKLEPFIYLWKNKVGNTPTSIQIFFNLNFRCIWSPTSNSLAAICKIWMYFCQKYWFWWSKKVSSL